ncbi:hypothetical protein GCM10027271_36510 [Saccharopolyspora gloriosae]|uniref:Uncharacterized protein n=1 Tax=Saccharopolyspora gloriosae TaxID=455344 RepID=A0A840NHA6_9PSEU|nr:hypothetical protein [Saccharopolyspora gloriosae]MBB5069455.1 hypothetical protein [Saccharopolyspora gloriosae]
MPFRESAPIAVPGAVIGAVAGAFAGPLASLAQQPPWWTAVTTLALVLPLALSGGGHGLLLAAGLLRPGMFAPAAAYWLVAFPLARLLHETITWWVLSGSPGLREPLAGFLAYQALIGTGFAIGFVWLHERLAPHWFLRLAARNALADALAAHYVRQAGRPRAHTRRADGR